MIPILTRDLLLNMLLGLTALVVLVLAQINPPAKDAPEIPPPGMINVLACWQSGPIDVDIWAIGPGQKLATGYPPGRKSDKVWSLLRDDLGTAGDDDNPVNCETMSARIIPDGREVVNLHGYSLPTGPVSVHVEIAINGTLFVKSDIMLNPGQEITVAQWRMRGGAVVPDSENKVYVPLREGGR